MNCEEAAQHRSGGRREAPLPADVAEALREHQATCRACARECEHEDQIALIIAGAEAERRPFALRPEVRAEVRRERVIAALPLVFVLLIVAGAAGIVTWGPMDQVLAWFQRTDPAPRVPDGAIAVQVTRTGLAGADSGGNSPLAELIAESDLIVTGRVRTVTADDAPLAVVTIGDALRGDRAELDTWKHAFEGKGHWRPWHDVALFIRRSEDGTARLAAPSGGKLSLPIDGWIDADALRELVNGRAPSAESMHAIVKDHGARRLFELARYADVSNAADAQQLEQVVGDALNRLDDVRSDDDAADAARDLAAALHFSSVASTAAPDRLMAAQAHLDGLPPDEIDARLSIARELADSHRAWARSVRVAALDRAVSAASTDPSHDCPRYLEVAIAEVGKGDTSQLWSDVRAVLLSQPRREVAVLAATFDVLPEQVETYVVKTIATDPVREDQLRRIENFASLLVRVNKAQVDDANVDDWLHWYLPTLPARSPEDRALFLTGLQRAGRDSAGRRMAPTIFEMAQAAETPEALVYLLRCHLAVGGPLEDFKARLRGVLTDPSHARPPQSILHVIRALEEIRGAPVLPRREPTEDEIRKSAVDLAHDLI